MVLKGDQTPVIQEEVLYRPKNQIALFEEELIDDTVVRTSQGVACAPFRKFAIYVHVDFDGTAGDDLLHIEVEFLDRWTELWYSYKQGLFAALFYEDADTVNGIWECFQGDVLGRAIRVKLTGATVAGADHFHVSIAVDFWS